MISADRSNESVSSEMNLLYLDDIQRMFRCGRSKAGLMLDKLEDDGVAVRIGNRPAVSSSELMGYLERNGGIQVRWPKRDR